jgi:aspartate 1-decarboxylase
MMRKFLRSKLHRGTVTGADLHYEGSIGIDAGLIRAANMSPNEAVHVWNLNNGERFETYVIPLPEGSGEIRLNGAAARLAHVGDTVIIATFCWIPEEAAGQHSPTVILLDERNRIVRR